MARINGKMVANVTIDASAGELFMALAEEFKIKELFEEHRDEYSKVMLIEEKNEKKPYIVRYENTTYHGSPHYEEKSRRKITTEQYRIAQFMQEIYDTLKDMGSLLV